jgi:hypothetical protein
MSKVVEMKNQLMASMAEIEESEIEYRYIINCYVHVHREFKKIK